MLATLGFTIVGICFGVFAYTFNILTINKVIAKLSHFSYAYYCLALAFVTWGIAAAIGGDDILSNSVIVGNSFLLLGTLFMLNVWLNNRNSKAWLWLAALVSVVLLFVRVSYYPPVPYIIDGILIFNSPVGVELVLGLIFLFVWLPVNIKVAKLITNKIQQGNIASIYSSIYVTATIAALIFLSARRVTTVVLSFIAIGVCFVMLIGSNILVKKIEEEHGTH